MGRSSTVPRLLGGILVGLLLTTFTLTPAQPASAAVLPRPTLDASDRVFILGDSLTAGCAEAIRARYRYADIPVTVNARAGRTTDEGMGILLNSQEARRATVWVIALGTNDAMSRTDFAARIAVARALAGNRPIIWINVFRLGRDEPINAAIADAARTDPRFWTMQFKPWIVAFPSLLLPDKIHLTKPASQWRATLYGPTF